jgi:hypothetical protein
MSRQASGKVLEAAASESLEDRDILCFSHDWNGDPLSKTHLMRLLARNNCILWVAPSRGTGIEPGCG